MNETHTDKILGARRLSNYFWLITLFLSGLGFFLAGLSSYFKINLLIVTDPTKIEFIPQGIVMTFYGTLGLGFSCFLAAIVFWNIGGGYNKYDQENQKIEIVRMGFPGKNRVINIGCNWSDVDAVEMEVEEGLNPKRELYLCLKDQRKLPLTEISSPKPLIEIEQQAIAIANRLNVKIKGI